MSTVNKAILIGRLGQDPEIRYLPNNTAVVNFSVATDHKGKDDAPAETTWHRVVYFGKTAEATGKRAHKGAQVYVEGRMVIRKYNDRAGVEHRTFEVHAERVYLLGARDDPPHETHEPQPPASSAKDVAAAAAKKNIKQSHFDDLDDDIPF